MSGDAWSGPVRRHLAGVAPYAAAGRQARSGLRLDANENASGPVWPEGRAIAAATGGELHRYPDSSGGPLRAALSRHLDCGPDRLWLGSGADDVIDVLVRALVEPGEPLVTTTPSYDMYRQRGAAHGAAVREIALDGEFDLDPAVMIEAARDASLVFVCSPNNPTGNLLSPERILRVLEETGAVVAVDEAYVEFAAPSAEPAVAAVSLARFAGTEGFERLAVIRTLSKAWGLAGLRTGYLVGAPALVRLLDVVGLPYRLTEPAIRLGAQALAGADEMRRRVVELAEERQRVADALRAFRLRVLPSDANFLLFFVADAARVHARLADEHGIVVRRRDVLPGLAGGLRVTIGAPTDNDRFLCALESALEW